MIPLMIQSEILAEAQIAEAPVEVMGVALKVKDLENVR